jgi:hypothetical protein
MPTSSKEISIKQLVQTISQLVAKTPLMVLTMLSKVMETELLETKTQQ